MNCSAPANPCPPSLTPEYVPTPGRRPLDAPTPPRYIRLGTAKLYRRFKGELRAIPNVGQNSGENRLDTSTGAPRHADVDPIEAVAGILAVEVIQLVKYKTSWLSKNTEFVDRNRFNTGIPSS